MDLIIAARSTTQERLRSLISQDGQSVSVVDSETALLRACLRGQAQLAFVDLDMGPLSSQELITLLREVDDRILLVPVVGENHSDLEFSIRSVGVFYYMIKPIDPDELRDVIESAERTWLARAERAAVGESL